jgi:hypothetical protein
MVLNWILAQTQQTPNNSAIRAVILAVTISLFAAIKIARRRKKQPRFSFPRHPAIEPLAGAPLAAPASQIDSVRALLGPAPRKFPARLASYLSVIPPAWMEDNQDDEMWLNVRHQERVRRDGMVVWGTIVQANNTLFAKNNSESGASVIYSPDPWFDKRKAVLAEIAHRCFELKGTDPADPESAACARMLTNEMTRAMGLKIPRVFTGDRRVYHSSMLMPRKHLPKGFLSGSHFPVWIDSKGTGAVVLVPAAFWPASLTAEWDVESE